MLCCDLRNNFIIFIVAPYDVPLHNTLSISLVPIQTA